MAQSEDDRAVPKSPQDGISRRTGSLLKQLIFFDGDRVSSLSAIFHRIQLDSVK